MNEIIPVPLPFDENTSKIFCAALIRTGLDPEKIHAVVEDVNALRDGTRRDPMLSAAIGAEHPNAWREMESAPKDRPIEIKSLDTEKSPLRVHWKADGEKGAGWYRNGYPVGRIEFEPAAWREIEGVSSVDAYAVFDRDRNMIVKTIAMEGHSAVRRYVANIARRATEKMTREDADRIFDELKGSHGQVIGRVRIERIS